MEAIKSRNFSRAQEGYVLQSRDARSCKDNDKKDDYVYTKTQVEINRRKKSHSHMIGFLVCIQVVGSGSD